MITLSDAARNACADAVVDLLDVSGPGTIDICTAGFAATLATLTLSNPAFDSAVAGLSVANAITQDSSTAAGTAAAFRAKDGAGSVIFSGTVGTSDADLIFNSVTFTSSGICQITSFTYTQPATDS